MQLKNQLTSSAYLFIFLFSFSFSVSAYDCKTVPLKLSSTDKVIAFKALSKMNRQQVVSGALSELTAKKFSKENAAKAELLLDYLEKTETNADQRAFFKLLQSGSEVGNEKAHALKMNEVCELMDKVNKLK